MDYICQGFELEGFGGSHGRYLECSVDHEYRENRA
jgi:hypothetical protein